MANNFFYLFIFTSTHISFSAIHGGLRAWNFWTTIFWYVALTYFASKWLEIIIFWKIPYIPKTYNMLRSSNSIPSNIPSKFSCRWKEYHSPSFPLKMFSFSPHSILCLCKTILILIVLFLCVICRYTFCLCSNAACLSHLLLV